MHAGMIPHQAWRTQHRLERERQTAERKEGGKTGECFDRSGCIKGKIRCGKKRGERWRTTSRPVFPASVGRVRPTGVPISRIVQKGMFSITACASRTPSRRALKSLSPRYLDSSFCFAPRQVHPIFVQATLDASQTQFARACLRR